MAKSMTIADKEREVLKCKLRVQAQNPFWSMWLYSDGGLKFLPDTDPFAAEVGWAATDGKTIWVTDKFLGLKTQEQDYTLVHELLHKQGCHAIRRKAARKMGTYAGLPYDDEVFTHTVEVWTNACTLASKIGALPDIPGLRENNTDPKVTFANPLVELYRRYYQEKQGGGGKGWADSGLGKPGQGDLQDPAGAATPDAVDQAEAEARVMTKTAAEGLKAIGRAPGALERWLVEQAEPKVDWRQLMSALFKPWIGREKADFTRLNVSVFLRTGIIAPKRRGIRAGQIIVIGDTSGSIGTREMDAFLGEMVGILQDVRPVELIVTGIDCRKPKKWAVLKSVEEMALAKPAITGGGGTDFRPAFEWIKEQEWHPAAVVYLTDAMGPFPDEAPGYPVFWGVTTKEPVPWGERVQIDIEDLRS
jgi:hypothetical protein